MIKLKTLVTAPFTPIRLRSEKAAAADGSISSPSKNSSVDNFFFFGLNPFLMTYGSFFCLQKKPEKNDLAGI